MAAQRRVLVVAGKEMTVPEFLRSLPDQVSANMGPDRDAFRAYCETAAQIAEDETADARSMTAFDDAELSRIHSAARRDQEIAKFFVVATDLLGAIATAGLAEMRKRSGS